MEEDITTEADNESGFDALRSRSGEHLSNRRYVAFEAGSIVGTACESMRPLLVEGHLTNPLSDRSEVENDAQ